MGNIWLRWYRSIRDKKKHLKNNDSLLIKWRYKKKWRYILNGKKERASPMGTPFAVDDAGL